MNASARLSELVRSIPGEPIEIQQDTLITGIELDSRRILPGNLFIALIGTSSDGHRFIPEAIQRGAAAIVGTLALDNLPVPYIRVEDGRQALAFLSAAFYGFPAHNLVMTGVTGTDGKTTTANLIYQVLRAAGLRAGLISTVNAVIGDETLDTGFHVTTPEAPEVQRYLARMVAAGLTHVVLEATSHGLAQQRVAACEFDLGVVTNVTHEHLDFHGSYDAYLQAKGSLFGMLARTPGKPSSAPRGAVLNRDDASYDYLAAITEVPQLSFGLHPHAQVTATNITQMSPGLRFTVSGIDLQERRFDFPVDSKLVGAFNLSNCLAAIAATVGVIGVDAGAAQRGIVAMTGVPGRMERLDLGQEFTAIVDFAHTPNALRRALETARELATGRVIAVFGSAGLRDQEKRGLMAQVSAELADLTVLTAEDPRSESLESILDEMAAGAMRRGAVEGKTFWRIPDRGEAIRFAVQIAQQGDLVIVCGKGHEQSMCFGEIEYPWDDRVALHAVLAERLGVPGPGMPFLPTSS